MPRKPALKVPASDKVKTLQSLFPDGDPSHEDTKTVSPDNVKAGSGVTKAAPRKRVSQPHVTLYLSDDVQHEFRKIALDRRVRTQAIYHEALREYLHVKYALDFDALMGAKAEEDTTE